ncbi:MAG: hypothetical protein ACI4HI_10170 [Lachnospiraceae bacterium]
MENNILSNRMNFACGRTFYEKGTPVKQIALLLKGTVSATNECVKMRFESGSWLGSVDLYQKTYLFDYKAETDCMIAFFDFTELEQLHQIFQGGKNYQQLLVMSAISQFRSVEQVYQKLFEPYVTVYQQMQKEELQTPRTVERQYLKEVMQLDKSVYRSLFSSGENIAIYHIELCAKLIHQMAEVAGILINTFGKEALGLVEKEKPKAKKDAPQGKTIETEEQKQEVLAELSGSLGKLLNYGKIEKEPAIKFQVLVKNFRELPDRGSTDMEVRKLRKEITKQFYDIYEKVFFEALKDENIPRIVEMFLRYGYMDEQMFGEEVLLELYQFYPDTGSNLYHLFTIYDWLCAIYKNERQPSKDQMDMDYKEQLVEIKKRRQMTKAEEEDYLNDQEAKVSFEIHNMITNANRLMSEDIATFCPILTEEEFMTGVQKSFLDVERVEAVFEHMREIDYSLFYRERLYHDPENKIDNTFVMKQVLPDIILMPTVGTRGIMWQDISEKKRDTPARFVLPAFFEGNLEQEVIKMCGAFRWEMCRTVQGVYWNDIREHSLTSEYNDYIQFYRKNSELSEEMRTKLRAQIKSCRNNPREVFIKDYTLWIQYESQGAPRLNKVVRRIMYRYCPFSKKIREKLSVYPAFTEAGEIFKRDRAKKVRDITYFNKNVENKNGTVTQTLLENLDFYANM